MILSETWFMDGDIDYELQKYRLLAYLQDVKKSFNETKLYPQLADIVAHYNNLIAFRTNKRLLQDGFPKKLSSIDPESMEIIFERLLNDDEMMRELEDITSFALAEMKETINEGAEIYELVEKQMLIKPVGIMPLYKNEGYVFLSYTGRCEVRIYTYNVSIFEHKEAKYRSIRMTYLDSRVKTLANTFEQIKLDIVREIRTLPNPAVYKVECTDEVPFYETLLPIAKRVLVRHI
jgi:hypothetical protein